MKLIDYVEFNGDRYYIYNDILTLNNKSVESISQIINLDHFSELKELHLSNNLITIIEGLDHLKNLKFLTLNDNKIKKLSGLEKLENLEELILSKMKINATDIMTKSLSIRTETVGNEEASVLLLKKLSLKDRNKMRDSIDKYEGGVETEIEIECPECGDVSVSDLDIGQSSFFFPSE